VPVLKVQEHGNWVSGTAWHAVETGIELLSADGMAQALVTTTTSLRGEFEVELRDRVGSPVLTQPGDRVEVHLPGVTLPVTVVPLTARADAVADQVTGIGPIQSPLEVQLYQEGVGWRSTNVSTNADGKYLADYGPGVDIRNGDFGNVSYTDPKGQVVWVRYVVPWVQVQERGPYVEDLVTPGALISVTLTSPNGEARAEGFSASHPLAGSFATNLLSPWDRRVQVRAGDQIRVESQATDPTITIDVPPLTAIVDPELRTVSGSAPPDARLQIVLYKVDGDTFQVEVQADSTGQYRVDFGPMATIEAGDTGYVYYALASGHQVYTYFDAPWIWLWLDDGSIGGQALPNARVIGLLQDASGQVLARGATQADERGQFSLTTSVACGVPGRPMAGNHLDPTLQAEPQGEALADRHVQLDIPVLTASVDAFQDTISGLAPPGGLVKVYLESRWAPVQVARASPAGEYVVYLNGQIDLKAGDYGFVATVAPGGHEIRRRFAIPWVQLQVGVDSFEGRMPPGARFLASLYDSSRSEKGVGHGQASDQGSFVVILQDAKGEPVFIQGGDRLELSLDGDVVLTAEVPALSVRMVAGGHEVTGSGPALQEVEVQLYRNRGWGDSRRVTTDAAGQYAVEFEGPAFSPGDYVLVYASDTAGNRFVDQANTLWMNLAIDSNHVSGRADLGSDVTVMVRDGSGVARATAVTTNLELRSASGELRATTDIPTNSTGAFDAYLLDRAGQPATVQTGDVVELIVGDATLAWFVVPELTASVNLPTASIGGSAAPGSPVRVELHSGGCTYTQEVLADYAGAYVADFDSVALITAADSGFVYWSSPDGNAVFTRYQVAGYQTYLPFLTNGGQP
jgi:hypothetical protein